MNPQADINFERELWETAVTLRGTVASADYKHYVLPLLFLHHLADGGTAFPWQATTRGRHGETRRVQGQEDTLSKPIPLDYGKFYHIYSRGIDRCTIFFEERNYRFFMKRWAQYVEPVADTFAYALLGNHFHAIIRTRTAEEQEAWHAQTLRVSETRGS